MKTIRITHKGKPIDVELDDDIAFGKLQGLLGKMSMDSLDKFDIIQFMKGLALVVITKCDLQVKTQNDLDNLPARTVMQLLKEVGKLYPLKDYMQEVAEMLGEKEAQTTA